jgi:hypothetical protein
MSLVGDLLALVGIVVFGAVSLGLAALCQQLRER